MQVFYDEFTKFVPAYILKREEEKRLKQEQEPKTGKPKSKGKSVVRANTNEMKRNQDESSIEKSHDQLHDYSSGSEMELFHQDSLEQPEKTYQMAEFENFITDIKTQIKDKKDFFASRDKGSSDGSSLEDEMPKKLKPKKKKKEKQVQAKDLAKEKPKKKHEGEQPKKVKVSKT